METKMNLNNIYNLHALDYHKRINFIGMYNNKKINISLRMKSIINFDNIKLIFNNDTNYKFEGTVVLNSDMFITYPYNNFNNIINRTKEIETYEMYIINIYPKIIKKDITWICNILNGISEQENIIFQNDNFVLIQDYKWDGLDLDNLYCLAIVKDYNLRSIRDLTTIHINLLEEIYNTGLNVIQEKYAIDKNQIRVYLHYYPSVWHLHVHFNLHKNDMESATVDYCHLLYNVISNIKLIPDYYQKINLEVIKNSSLV